MKGLKILNLDNIEVKKEDLIPTEEEKPNEITENRETKDSVQIHSDPDLLIIDEEIEEKCYSM